MAISLYDDYGLEETLAEAGRQLDRLERVYMYINRAEDNDASRSAAKRLVILAQTSWRASIACMINGKASLPHKSWNISLDDLDPCAAVHVR